MTVEPMDGFRSLITHHCVTGSMLHIYEFHDHHLSEDMLLGIGAGLGYFYWQQKGMPPMILGRGNVHRPGVEGLEITSGRRTGVKVERFHTSSRRKAENSFLKSMQGGEPLMIHVDMGFLPFFDLPEDYHFGQHVVVVCGYDPDSQQALIADRDEPLHPISLEDLAMARGSTFKPFPPQNTWYEFDFSAMRLPREEEVRESILDVCTTMLEGPISNMGVRGIRKTAKRAGTWSEGMDDEALRWACFNNHIFIDAEGGTGGGIFRYMYSRFLEEAAKITDLEEMIELSTEMKIIGDRWQEVAAIFKRASKHDHPASVIPDVIEPILNIADMEESAWIRLRELVST